VLGLESLEKGVRSMRYRGFLLSLVTAFAITGLDAAQKVDVAALRKQRSEISKAIRAKQKALGAIRSELRRDKAFAELGERVVAAKKAAAAKAAADKRVAASQKALDKANGRAKAALAAALTADRDAAQLLKTIQQQKERIAAAQKALREAETKLRDVSRKVGSESEKVKAARKAAGGMNKKHRALVAETTRAEQARVKRAEEALKKAVERKLAGDPKARAIMKEIDALKAKEKALSEAMKPKRKPRKERRRA
jgi:hypothetical protein